MHTVETDGKNTIEEMAEAASERGYEYMAITDHSKNLAFAIGLTDERALAHIEKIRAVEKTMKGIRIFAGIEVDILGDGTSIFPTRCSNRWISSSPACIRSSIRIAPR